MSSGRPNLPDDSSAGGHRATASSASLRSPTTVRTAICCALVLAACGCGQDWTVLRQPGSGFVVTMPDSVTCGADREATFTGTLTGHFCVAELERSFFERPISARLVVSWLDLPPGFDRRELAPVSRELAEQALPAETQTTAAPAMVDGAEAIEYVTESLVGDGPDPWHWTIRDRFLVHQDRLFRVGVHGVMGPTSERAWRRMLDSFHFVVAEQPAL